MKPRSTSMAAALAAACYLPIGPLHAQEFTQRPPHVHGKVTLDVALDGQQLVIELDSPAINVVGFEHPPSTDQERAAVRTAEAYFRDGRGLFALPPDAGCRFKGTEVKTPQWETTPDDEGKPENPSAPHADYEPRFSYQCHAPDQLTWLKPTLLGKLHNLIEARVNIAAPKGQRSEVVTSGQARVAFP